MSQHKLYRRLKKCIRSITHVTTLHLILARLGISYYQKKVLDHFTNLLRTDLCSQTPAVCSSDVLHASPDSLTHTWSHPRHHHHRKVMRARKPTSFNDVNFRSTDLRVRGRLRRGLELPGLRLRLLRGELGL